MPSIKGLVLQSRYEFLEKAIDGRALKELTERLSPQTREIINDQIFLTNRYPFAVLREVDEVLPQLISLPLEKMFRQIGEEFAPVVVDRYFHNYLETRDTKKFLQQFQRLYPYLWDFGHMDFHWKHDALVQIQFTYEEDIHKPYCWFMQAFLSESFRLISGRNVSVKEKSCDAENGESCLYEMSWKK